MPGGFGTRGVEGKVLAAQYARTANKPYLGICLGMQIAVIEFARNVLGLADANSAEFDPATPTPVVVFMPEGSITHKGGTMRLGTRRTILETVDCMTAKLYQVRQGPRDPKCCNCQGRASAGPEAAFLPSRASLRASKTAFIRIMQSQPVILLVRPCLTVTKALVARRASQVEAWLACRQLLLRVRRLTATWMSGIAIDMRSTPPWSLR